MKYNGIELFPNLSKPKPEELPQKSKLREEMERLGILPQEQDGPQKHKQEESLENGFSRTEGHLSSLDLFLKR